jgi:ribosomal protein L37AE/L43A
MMEMSMGVISEYFQRWRFRCPYCGSVSISKRVKTSDYRCSRCGQIFTEPVDASR